MCLRGGCGWGEYVGRSPSRGRGAERGHIGRGEHLRRYGRRIGPQERAPRTHLRTTFRHLSVAVYHSVAESTLAPLPKVERSQTAGGVGRRRYWGGRISRIRSLGRSYGRLRPRVHPVQRRRRGVGGRWHPPHRNWASPAALREKRVPKEAHAQGRHGTVPHAPLRAPSE
jgi:hypothetical protein